MRSDRELFFHTHILHNVQSTFAKSKLPLALRNRDREPGIGVVFPHCNCAHHPSKIEIKIN